MIEPQAIARLLPEQRWFGAKDRDVERVEIVDEVSLDDGDPALLLGIARVHLSSGSQLYQVLVLDEAGHRVDPVAEPERLGVVGRLMAHGATLAGSNGQFHFGGPGLDPLSPPESNVRALDAEQTNTSFVLDDTVVLKLFRRLDVGPNPDLELNRLLTNEGWPHVPAQLGEISYTGELEGAETEIDLAIAQELVTGATDGWPFVKKEVRDLIARGAGASGVDPQAFIADEGDPLLVCVEELGNVTASMHLALSRDVFEPELAAEPVSEAELESWSRSIRASVRESIEGDEELRPISPHLQDALRAVERIQVAGMKTRIHGDYHLGQVMLGDKGWLVIDFEGEPTRPISERRKKRSPLRDVAGMLRSFSYAATASLFETNVGDDEMHGLQRLAEEWEVQARNRFVTAYTTTSYEGNFLPPDEDDVTALLEAFEIEKALYELDYERSHRPQWDRIPRRGLVNIAERRWLRSSK